MKRWSSLAFGLALGLALAATAASSADYKTLRGLTSPPPTTVVPADPSKVQPVQLLRVVVHPRDGEAWALVYASTTIPEEGTNFHFLTWRAGVTDGDLAAFQQVFDEELRKAGFKTDSGDALFGEGDSSADLKIGALVDDIRGRFCIDCPSLLNPGGIPATVLMRANWEIYSALDRKVIGKVTTEGGGDYKVRLTDTIIPAVMVAFRENVRQLIASDTFRREVAKANGPATPAASLPSRLDPISLVAGGSRGGLSQAPSSVAVVFASDGSGSGFLISNDGYLLTNHHVVGSSKYVKLKWSDGSETVGEVIRSDRRRDVALLKADPHGRAALGLRHTGAQQGEAVYAIGAPLGEALQGTMTKGIVSANRVHEGQSFIQSDVAVTHGNSGGPLLDEQGQVLGITDWGIGGDSGNLNLNFFIPIDDALRALALTTAPADSPQVATAPAKAPAAHKP